MCLKIFKNISVGPVGSGKATISKLAEFQLISYKLLGQKVKVKMWMFKLLTDSS